MQIFFPVRPDSIASSDFFLKKTTKLQKIISRNSIGLHNAPFVMFVD
jgi:hypothetical protein